MCFSLLLFSIDRQADRRTVASGTPGPVQPDISVVYMYGVYIFRTSVAGAISCSDMHLMILIPNAEPVFSPKPWGEEILVAMAEGPVYVRCRAEICVAPGTDRNRSYGMYSVSMEC